MSDFAAWARTRPFSRVSLSLSGLASCAVLLAWVGFLYRTEPDWGFFFAVLASYLALVAFVAVISRRPRFAFIAAGLVFVAIFAAARSKHALVAMNLHVYDVLFYGSDLAQIEFFLSTYPRQGAMLVGALVVAFSVGVLAWRWERPAAWGGLYRLAGLAGAGGLCALGAVPLASRNADFFNDRYFAFSAFLSSLGDLPQLARYQGMIQSSPDPILSPLPTGPITCRPGSRPPDIVLTLNESSMPPGIYPNLTYPDDLKPFFTSMDGKVHPLRVETFGGGTWLTDFTVLTGLSTRSFGNLRNFVANFMTGRLHHSLPQYLKACGYETSLIFPASADFAGVGRFYHSIGFDHVIDTKIHKAPDPRQRDAFYLGEIARIIEAAAQSRRAPQFVVMATMSTHSPWDFRFAPEEVPPGANLRWNKDPEFDEYLWRLQLALRDRTDFRSRLARTVPERKILYVGYGDHQPALATVPVEDAATVADDGKSWQLDPTSRAFETYYTIDTQGFTPAPSGSGIALLEAAHLPTVIVQAAGLPLDPVFRQRVALMGDCKGLYATCEDQGKVLAFQRWLLDSGLLAQR